MNKKRYLRVMSTLRRAVLMIVLHPVSTDQTRETSLRSGIMNRPQCHSRLSSLLYPLVGYSIASEAASYLFSYLIASMIARKRVSSNSNTCSATSKLPIPSRLLRFLMRLLMWLCTIHLTRNMSTNSSHVHYSLTISRSRVDRKGHGSPERLRQAHREDRLE